MYTYQGRGCVHIKVMAEIPKTTTTNGAKTLGWYKLPNLNWCRSTSINSVFHRYIMGAGIGGKKSWSPNGWITSKILKMIHDLKSIDQKPFTQMLEPRISDFWSATQNRKTGSRFEVPPITYICLFESSLVSKIGCFFGNENFKSQESMAFPNDGESTTLIPPGICEQKCLPSTFAYKRSFTMRCFRFHLLIHDVFGKLSRGLLTSNPDSAWCCPRQAPSAGQNRVIGMDRRSLLPCVGWNRHVSWGYQVSVVSQNTCSSLRRYTLQETNRHA